MSMWTSKQPTKPPEIVCHRGANRHAPENTLPAAAKCLEWGVDYLELDVNMSADGVHYLFHGPTLEPTTDGRGNFADLTSTEIDRLDAGSWFSPEFTGTRVPRLEEFLGWVAGKAKLFIDIKRANLPELVHQVHAAGVAQDCFFWAEDDATLLELRRLWPEAVLKVNVATVADVIAADQRFGAKIVEVRLKSLSQALVTECRTRGLRIMVYHPAAQPDAFRQILRWGVDLVNLDDADLFQATLAAPAPAAPQDVPLPRVGRVVLIMLDGCRPDALLAADAPHLRHLMQHGASTLAARSVMPSVTLPCHTSIFRSQSPAAHGILSNEWTPAAGLNPSLCDIIHRTGYDTAAFYTWEPLRNLAAPGSLDTLFYRSLSHEGFRDLCDMAATWLPRLLPVFSFVYLEATDAYGHLYGWMSQAYLQALGQSDAALGRILAGLDDQAGSHDTLFVAMADHGGHDHGHGTDQPADMTVPLIFCGPGIKSGYTLPDHVSILDVAPTILYALGIPIPQEWQGQPRLEIFEEQVT
jgi:glycerophosphoryl diester phosphodiesterase